MASMFPPSPPRSSATPATTPTLAAATPEPDPFNLQRYVDAQDRDGAFDRVLAAIRDGSGLPRPSTAWMWFVFPQMDHCETRYRPTCVARPGRDVWPPGHALTSLDEARALLRHPVLGPRMARAAQALLDTRHADVFCVLGHRLLDVRRVCSAITILHEAARRPLCLHDSPHRRRGGAHPVFRRVLDKLFVRAPDSDDEMTWGEPPLRPFSKPRCARHQPTLRRLEARNVDAVEKRMASGAEDVLLCACPRTKEELNRLDAEFMEKVRDKRKKRMEKG